MRYLNYRPASNFKRTIAFIIDVFPVQIALYFVSAAIFEVSPITDPFDPPHVVAAAAYAKILITSGTFCIWILHCIIGEASPWQGTFGKRMMGICVRSIHNHHLTFKQILQRNASKILSFIPCGLGFFAAFIVHGNRAWHDSLSNTAVSNRH